jgi:hypothetical protein
MDSAPFFKAVKGKIDRREIIDVNDMDTHLINTLRMTAIQVEKGTCYKEWLEDFTVRIARELSPQQIQTISGIMFTALCTNSYTPGINIENDYIAMPSKEPPVTFSEEEEKEEEVTFEEPIIEEPEEPVKPNYIKQFVKDCKEIDAPTDKIWSKIKEAFELENNGGYSNWKSVKCTYVSDKYYNGNKKAYFGCRKEKNCDFCHTSRELKAVQYLMKKQFTDDEIKALDDKYDN